MSTSSLERRFPGIDIGMAARRARLAEYDDDPVAALTKYGAYVVVAKPCSKGCGRSFDARGLRPHEASCSGTLCMKKNFPWKEHQLACSAPLKAEFELAHALKTQSRLTRGECVCKEHLEDVCMVGCESGESSCPGGGWFHPPCVGLTNAEVEAMDGVFLCPQCANSTATHEAKLLAADRWVRQAQDALEAAADAAVALLVEKTEQRMLVHDAATADSAARLQTARLARQDRFEQARMDVSDCDDEEWIPDEADDKNPGINAIRENRAKKGLVRWEGRGVTEVCLKGTSSRLVIGFGVDAGVEIRGAFALDMRCMNHIMCRFRLEQMSLPELMPETPASIATRVAEIQADPVFSHDALLDATRRKAAAASAQSAKGKARNAAAKAEKRARPVADANEGVVPPSQRPKKWSLNQDIEIQIEAGAWEAAVFNRRDGMEVCVRVDGQTKVLQWSKVQIREPQGQSEGALEQGGKALGGRTVENQIAELQRQAAVLNAQIAALTVPPANANSGGS